jgi:hypothetical protein
MSKRGSSKVDLQVILLAIRKCSGIRTRVAETLGISRNTLRRYSDLYPEVAEAFHDEDNRLLDSVESKLTAFTQGKVKNSDGTTEKVPLALQLDAIKFVLRCKGKERGYTERVEQEVTGKDGTPIAPPAIVIQPVKVKEE